MQDTRPELSQLTLEVVDYQIKNKYYNRYLVYCFHADDNIEVCRESLGAKVSEMREKLGDNHQIDLHIDSYGNLTIVDFNSPRR